MDATIDFGNGVILSDEEINSTTQVCLAALKNALPEEARFYDVAVFVLERCQEALGKESKL